MRSTKAPSPLAARLWGIAGLLAAACAFAQLAPKAQPGGQVNPQVNTALYGGGVSASVRYADIGSTSIPMDSELRYASWTSGALPSEIRMGYQSLGPLHPAGPMAYIPPPKPTYMPDPAKAPPKAAGSAAFSNTTVVNPRSMPAPSAAYVAPRSVAPASVSPALVSQAPISRGPINPGALNTGAIRYAR